MLSELGTSLRSFKLRKRDEKEDFLNIPAASMKDATVDLGKRQVTVGSISTGKGRIVLRRVGGGTLNVQNLVVPDPKAPAPKKKTEKKAPAREWTYTIKSIAADGYTVRTEDLTTQDPVVITTEQIRIRGENISNKKAAKGRTSLALKIGKKGSVSTAGVVGLNPVSASLSVSAKGVDITQLQPYISEKLNLYLIGGDFSAQGRLSASYSEKDGPKVNYAGEMMLSNFGSVDTIHADDFLKWETLHLNKMEVGYKPISVKINEVALSNFYSRIIIDDDGTLNVQKIMTGQDKPKTAPEPARAAAQVEENVEEKDAPAKKAVLIGAVTVQGGVMEFSDKSVKPGYSSKLVEVGGRVSGLSSEEEKFADIDLRGRLDNHAPLQITGTINPLREDFYQT